MAIKGIDLVEVYNSLWVEKYRPKSVDELAAPDSLKQFINNCIVDNDIPHLLFHGTPGTGKNSIVNILQKNLKAIFLIINASEERGIDVIRDKVQSFARSGAFDDVLKVVVLNEADGLNYTAQDSLRELMETSSKYCRFILTCNYVGRVSDAIRSRCKEFELAPKLKEVAERITFILENEKIDYEEDFIVALIKRFGTDIRKMLNECQTFSRTYNILKSSIVDTSNKYENYFEKIFGKGKISAKDTASIVKTMIFSEDIYSALSDYVLEKYNKPDLVIIIADYAYKSKIIVDKDLAFLSCIFTLKELV